MPRNRITKARVDSRNLKRMGKISSWFIFFSVVATIANVPIVASRKEQQLRGKTARRSTSNEDLPRRRAKSERGKKVRNYEMIYSQGGSEPEPEPEPKLEPEPETQTQLMTRMSGFQKLKRIVGGAEVEEPSRYPWFTQIVSVTEAHSGVDSCGGALIAPDLVLTAAHCTDPTRVYPGRHNKDVPAAEKLDVAEFVRHPEYGTGQSEVDFDIMITHLAQSSTNAPVRLNFDEEYPGSAGESLSLLGFGSTIGGPETGTATPPIEPSRILKTAETLYVPYEECAVAEDPDTGIRYGVSATATIVAPHWFCTTGPEISSGMVTSTCYGDSGGPVLKENYFDDNANGATNDLLMAVISGTSGYCGNPHLPLWNQRVSYHKEWIIEVGCALSRAPPAEWNCDGLDLNSLGGMAPDNNSVYMPVVDPTEAPVPDPTTAPTNVPTNTPTRVPTEAPVVPPTEAPVVPPTVPPTNAAVAVTDTPTASPTSTPTQTFFAPTDPPTNGATSTPTATPVAALTNTPTQIFVAPDSNIEVGTTSPTESPTPAVPTADPTARPTTERPVAFEVPLLNPDGKEWVTEEPTGYPTEGVEDEVEFVCPVCDNEDEYITNPDAVVFAPILGQKTCQELFDLASKGSIEEGSQCDSVLLTASVVCSCAVVTPSPSVSPTEATPSPTMAPSSTPTDQPSMMPNDSPSSQPTLAPSQIPSDQPSQGPSSSPTNKPSSDPTASFRPSVTPETCETIVEVIETNDASRYVDVTINFFFEDTANARAVGWKLTDPDEECFRIGVPSGTYTGNNVVENVQLVEGVNYKFALRIDDIDVPSGLFNMTSNNITLLHNRGLLQSEEGIIIKTPWN